MDSNWNEKQAILLVGDNPGCHVTEGNPVVESAKYVFERTNLVSLDERGIEGAARYISQKLVEETYTPSTWRTHPLHLCPPTHFSRTDPCTRATLNWIFLISSLNFSFWSEKEGTENGEHERFGVEWRAGWGSEERRVWTGYWSLVAAINRALEAGIPITDPTFYASVERCPDSTIVSIFTPAPQCTEVIPLLNERIAVIREVGEILCRGFESSFLGFMNAFETRHGGVGHGSALQLVRMVTENFPSFRDETIFEGRRVFFLKRAQILVAEIWAAFHPLSAHEPHPFFPAGVHELTMFADYRVPQILHHLGILAYPPALCAQLEGKASLAPGCREELSTRAASVLAVEAVREEMIRPSAGPDVLQDKDKTRKDNSSVSGVLIDFYLWDLAKRVEHGRQVIKNIATQRMLPAHRTRSIWY
ncbi:hypothetical protein EW145_g6675 [Phellinidium pouzarii]|uniref:Queuosine 5'-phosphate N-glycosylase/hydrolase n=1 Tax=Phellinidium pouzarii TaxID=167371 RepID=A0A4S4KX04_9AGAM|nr:hypothetical protein EW145_g6675 [Phellinidium pouzarii]